MVLYKDNGEKSANGSYRPINLCSFLGKSLEKVVTLQFNAHLYNNRLQQQAQHGFIPDRSTHINLLVTDA